MQPGGSDEAAAEQVADSSIEAELARAGDFGPAQRRYAAFATMAWAVHGAQVMSMVFVTKHAARAFPDDATLVRLNPTFFFAGWLAGLTLWGWMAARRGWLASLFAIEACVLVAGLTSAAAPSAAVFVAARFFCGFADGGVPTIAMGWISELVPPRLMSTIGTGLQFGFMAGSLAIDAASFALHGRWRVVCVLPSLMCSIILIGAAVLPESPRWLHRVGRTDEARRELRRIARLNGRASGAEATHELDCVLESGVESGVESSGDEATALVKRRPSDKAPPPTLQQQQPLPQRQATADSVVALVRTGRPVVMVTGAVALQWFVLSAAFFAFSLNTSELPGGEHLNMLFNICFQAPVLGLTGVMLEWAGRRLVTVGVFATMATTCLVLALASGRLASQLGGYSAVLSTLGYVSAAAGFSAVYIYSSELFPTEVRSVGLSLSSQSARLGAMASPLLVLLKDSSPVLPYAVMACVSVLAALASRCLPETRGVPKLESSRELGVLMSSR